MGRGRARAGARGPARVGRGGARCAGARGRVGAARRAVRCAGSGAGVGLGAGARGRRARGRAAGEAPGPPGRMGGAGAGAGAPGGSGVAEARPGAGAGRAVAGRRGDGPDPGRVGRSCRPVGGGQKRDPAGHGAGARDRAGGPGAAPRRGLGPGPGGSRAGGAGAGIGPVARGGDEMRVLLLALALLNPLERLDWAAAREVQAARRPAFEGIMHGASAIGRPAVVAGGLAVVLAVDLASGGGWSTVRLAVVALAGTNLVVEVLKRAVGRTRPDGERKRSNSSFPSSHAANAFALAWVLGARWRRGAPLFLALALTGGILAHVPEPALPERRGRGCAHRHDLRLGGRELAAAPSARAGPPGRRVRDP